MTSGWGDLWDVLTGKSQAESDAADARLKKLNDEKYARGEWTREQYDTAEGHRVSSAIDAKAQVAADFNAGAMEGLGNVADTVRTAANGVAETAGGFVWRAVPWWVWLLVLGYVAWQFGAVRRLLGKAVA